MYVFLEVPKSIQGTLHVILFLILKRALPDIMSTVLSLRKQRFKVGRDSRGRGGRVFRNMYKGHRDKTKGGRIKGGKWGWLGWGGEMETTVLEQQYKMWGKKEIKHILTM